MSKELIKRGHSTIVIGIDSSSSVIELNNAVKTLKTYKSISDTLKKPVSMYRIHNSSRRDADMRAMQFISLLSLLIDKNATDEFDTSDLKSFIYFDKVTDNQPTMSILEVSPNDESPAEKGTSIIATILVTKDNASTIKANTPEYFATCVVSDPSYDNADIRVNSVLGKLSNIIDGLQLEIKTLMDTKRVNKFKDIPVDDCDNEHGVVL